MYRVSRIAVGAVAMVVLVAANMVRASVLDQVPGESLIVVKVTNVKATSDKLAKFATDLGVAAFAPPLMDPLGFIREQAGITAGTNDAGDMAFVFIDPAVTGSDDQSFVVLIPVSDYGAFIGNFADAKTDGSVTEFTPNGAPSPVFAAQWGDYAAVAPMKEIASLKPTGMKVAGVTEKELGKDIVMLANTRSIRTKLQPHLTEGRAEIAKSIDEELSNDADMAKFGPTIKLGVDRLFDIADSFLRDNDASTVAINFVPDGLNISVVAEFTNGSYLGDFVSKNKNTTESFTVGLPAGKYLAFGGFTGDPVLSAKMVDDIAAPVVAELQKAGGKEADAVTKFYGILMDYIKATEGQTFGMVAPEGEVGQTALLQVVNIYTGDAAKMKAAYIGMMEGQSELMTAFGMPADQMSYTVTPGAKTIEGLAFDQVKGDFKIDGGGPEVEQMMKFMYGPDGMNFYVAELGADKLVQAFGIDDAMIAATVKATKDKTDVLGALPGVKAVTAQLPANKSGVFYVAIDEFVGTGLNVAKQFGFGMNVQMQPDLPPLAMSTATEGTAIRIDVHAPTQLISQLIAAGFQIAMQAQGGGRGGPGGL
ncbi:MAG TPA: hypothetical protein PLD59_14455 [Tepidisphaeraceae bacterium]|nr:hypothetical protein [Tepidisphaeraceae bacterium]